MRPADMTPIAVLEERHQHGTRVRYMTGCRCVPCRAANSRYEVERAIARKNGDWNGLVSADRSRRHLLKLSAAGVGRRAVSAACDISDSMLHEISLGRKKQIRARTERRILSVTKDAVADKALVNAGRTWRQIEWLMSEGLSKAEIARRLGYPRTIQFKRERMTARNVLKVERLVAQMRLGEGRRGPKKKEAAR